MQAIINRNELAAPLADLIILRHLKTIPLSWNHTNAYVEECRASYQETKLLNIDFNTVKTLLYKDLDIWKDSVIFEYKKKYRKLINWLSDNNVANRIDSKFLIQLFLNSKSYSFVKSLVPHLNEQVEWIAQAQEADYDQTLVIRNIVNNENILKYKLKTHSPFWFIDSGYTNFITGKKSWHRVVKNHIHHQLAEKPFPADRLSNLPSFPQKWRKGGNKILVVESSESHYKLFGTTLVKWRSHIINELAKYTDRPIEFRPKNLDRKTRTSVYDELKLNPDEYYCVISDASAAAIEAIWLGIPVITLGQHITNPVSRSELKDINNLYRGAIGDWLCALTYNQFTKKEIANGTAAKIIRKYYHV